MGVNVLKQNKTKQNKTTKQNKKNASKIQSNLTGFCLSWERVRRAGKLGKVVVAIEL